jgi:hypothetical protein
MSWSFGDQTGWMIGCGFMLLFSIGLGWIIQSLSFRFLSMGSLDQEQKVCRLGVILGASVALAIMSAFYVTSLSGFSQLEYRNGLLTMHYPLLVRTVALPVTEVMTVRADPQFKGQWRVVLITDTSGTYESALASEAYVHQASNFLKQQIAQPSQISER